MIEQQADQIVKDTLISALENLGGKCDRLYKLADLSEALNRKLNRTEGDPENECIKENIDKSHHDIVGLFNQVAEKMEEQINLIQANLNYAIEMID